VSADDDDDDDDDAEPPSPDPSLVSSRIKETRLILHSL